MYLLTKNIYYVLSPTALKKIPIHLFMKVIPHLFNSHPLPVAVKLQMSKVTYMKAYNPEELYNNFLKPQRSTALRSIT